MNLNEVDLKRQIEELRKENDYLQSRVQKLEEELENNSKAAENKISQVYGDLERANKELEQFAYIASHDLQEPSG